MKKDTEKQFDTGELSFKLQTIEEHSHDAIIGKDLHGVITSWNKGAEKIYGYTAEEIIGQAISILFPPGQADEIPWILQKIRRGETIGHYETVCTGKGCRQVHVSLKVTPIRNSRGEIVGASSIARDVTWRKKAEEELKTSEEQFRLIYEKSPLGIAFVDAEGLLSACNDKFTEIAGAPRERLVGFNMKTDVRDPNIISALSKAFAGQLAVYEGEYVTASGSKKIVMRTFYSPLQQTPVSEGLCS
ncbi:MAG: PAS domain-containing protein [Desulfobulbaceae bacterium]